jgi:hypothetical protein
MQSKAKNVADYLAELPADRRSAIEAVRTVILEHLDAGYEEGMQYGMIGYFVPHSVFPAAYHCDPKQPLPFAGLASQKNHMSLYLGRVYGHEGEETWFRDAWARTGKKLDMGKTCIRFKRVEDLALNVIAEAIRRARLKEYIAFYESSISKLKRPPSKSPAKARPKAKSAKEINPKVNHAGRQIANVPSVRLARSGRRGRPVCRAGADPL